MAQTLTLGSQFRQWATASPVQVSIHVDHGVPGSHLMWDIENTGSHPIALTTLVVHAKRGPDKVVSFDVPHVLAPQDSFVVPTDVDWSLLNARSVAVIDSEGREHAAPKRQFEAVRDSLRETIERRSTPLSARDFLFGAADMAFGIAILSLGFFMLMWAIATG